MDFLSKVSSKAGETIQTIKDSDITKKAKNYAEIPGLQVQIGKAEAAIKRLMKKSVRHISMHMWMMKLRNMKIYLH